MADFFQVHNDPMVHSDPVPYPVLQVPRTEKVKSYEVKLSPLIILKAEKDQNIKVPKMFNRFVAVPQ